LALLQQGWNWELFPVIGLLLQAVRGPPAGFTDINAAVLRLEKEVPDPAILARGLLYGSPIIDQVLARGGVEPEQIVDAIVQEYRHEFGTDRGRMPLQAIIFSAKKPLSMSESGQTLPSRDFCTAALPLKPDIGWRG
jgi:hypothetical protein